VTPPPRPLVPAIGRRPEIVGNGTDFSAQTSGNISKAWGSFLSPTEGLSETGNSNTFGLQLNTNPFMTPACNGAVVPSACQGWQQFVFGNPACGTNIPCIYMQYWLLNYGPTCPPSPPGTQGWASWGGNDCYLNLSTATPVPAQMIADLDQLSLSGEAAGPQSSDTDTVILSTGGGMYMLPFTDDLLNLAQSQWQAAEFNVLASCCAGQVNFNPGSTIVVATNIDDGTANAATCVQTGFTGETNNLTLAPPCCPLGGGGTQPGIMFTESNADATSICACPTYSAWSPAQAACVNLPCPNKECCLSRPGHFWNGHACISLPPPPPLCGGPGNPRHLPICF
jgi:hypothetical protein